MADRDGPDQAEPGPGRHDERHNLRSHGNPDCPDDGRHRAATASSPSVSVTVSSSATPSTAAEISQTIR